jgi:hypothetical protein
MAGSEHKHEPLLPSESTTNSSSLGSALDLLAQQTTFAAGARTEAYLLW